LDTRVLEPHRQAVRISHRRRTFFANFARSAKRGCSPHIFHGRSNANPPGSGSRRPSL